MASKRRVTIGSVVKGKDGKPDYIKVNNDVVLKKGQFLNLESKAQRISGIQEALKNGKMGPELADQLLESANKVPDFVRFEIFALVDK